MSELSTTTQADPLREALENYGEHRSDCPAFFDAKHECICGLSAALSSPPLISSGDMPAEALAAGEKYLADLMHPLGREFWWPGTFNWHAFWKAMHAPLAQSPAPQGEGMRERVSRVLNNLNSYGLHSEKIDAILAALATPIPSDRAGREEEIAKVKWLDELERLYKEASEGPWDRSHGAVFNKTELVAFCQNTKWWRLENNPAKASANARFILAVHKHFPEMAAALRQSASAGIERAAEWHEERERLAKMIEEYSMERKPGSERLVLAIAAANVRRGRKLTDAECLANLQRAMDEGGSLSPSASHAQEPSDAK